MITQQQLKEFLTYNLDTGEFTWRVTRGGSAKKGDIAGYVENNGYVRITIEGQRYFAHRLAFLYVDGSFPQNQSDHIDRNRSNNRWSNLRNATLAENSRNRSKYSNNTSGFRGVVRFPDGRFIAQIKHKGKRIYIGTYQTAELASNAYRVKAKEIFGKFYNDVKVSLLKEGEG